MVTKRGLNNILPKNPTSGVIINTKDTPPTAIVIGALIKWINIPPTKTNRAIFKSTGITKVRGNTVLTKFGIYEQYVELSRGNVFIPWRVACFWKHDVK